MMEQYDEYRPEKWRACDGVMFGAINDLRNLGKLAVYNLGLEEVVKNAPKRLSLKALAYLAQDYK